jgi:hypothetical protein
MGDLIKFYPNDAAKNPDHVLEQAVGNFSECLILGWDKEGYMDIRASLGLKKAELVLLCEQFKHNLLAGMYDLDDDG